MEKKEIKESLDVNVKEDTKTTKATEKKQNKKTDTVTETKAVPKKEKEVDQETIKVFEMYPSYNELWIDSRGGAWTFEVPNSKHYKK